MKRVLFLLMFGAAPLLSQQPGATPRDIARTWWTEVGLSLNSGAAGGIGTHASVITERRNRSLRVGFDRAASLKGSVTLNSVSASLGGHAEAGRLHITGFAGPAVVWGVADVSDLGVTRFEEYVTVGATANASALLALGSRLRVGVAAWGNVNSKVSTFGVGPRLHIRIF